MSPLHPTASPVQHTVSIHGTITLDPLRSDGPDALSTADLPDFTDTRLREIEIAHENLQQEVTIKRAADVFKTADGPGLITKPGKLKRAILDLHRPKPQKPNKLELIPPATLKLSDPADAPAVVKWLTKRHFCIIQLLLPFLLAAATAFAAVVDDDDSDDDDPDIDRPGFAV